MINPVPNPDRKHHITPEEITLLAGLLESELIRIVPTTLELPPTGVESTIYVVQNATEGSIVYAWIQSELRYQIITQDPQSIQIIRGGNANE